MVVAKEIETENLRIRVSPELKEGLDSLLGRKQITQQAAINSLLRWVLDQDDLIQSMILGQVMASEDLAELVMRRLAERDRGKKKLRPPRIGELRSDR